MSGSAGAIDPVTLWIVIIGMAIGSFWLRFAFLGFVGDKPLPAWLLRLLRYTAVSIIPALVTPLVLWPTATGGTFDPARALAALATIVTGLVFRSVIPAILAGAGTLWLMLLFLH